MPGAQYGSYAPEELYYQIEHLNLTLLEVQSVDWNFAEKIAPRGHGLGFQKDTYPKIEGPSKGTWSINRNLLARADNGFVFLDLMSGVRKIFQEPIAAASTTYTPEFATTMTQIYEIRTNVTNVVLQYMRDYVVSWPTGAITFPAATPEAYTIKYLCTARRNQNLIQNGGFEDVLGSLWVPLATATLARNSTPANVYAETYALACTPASVNDGFTYAYPINVQPGRTYRFRFKAKAAAAEVMAPSWNDGAADNLMTVVSGATLGTTFATAEFTFVATKAQVVNIKVKDTKASPGLFYVDEVALMDDSIGTSPSLYLNPMDGGLSEVPMFNIIGRRTIDGVAAHKLFGCWIDSVAIKSGAAYAEDLKGGFLDYGSE